MGKPKHRWTLEEENALRAGVDKYGTGKWRKILTDEDFAPCFIARTNVDLKDKWRNLCGNASSRVAFPRCSTYKETNEVDEVVQEVDIKELEADINEVEVNIVDEVIVQDYAQVLREVGYEEHEINVAVDQVEVLNELPIARHVESAMPMNIEDYQDAFLIDDTQESTLKPKLSLKLLFKAFKKPMLELKTSVEKMMRNKS